MTNFFFLLLNIFFPKLILAQTTINFRNPLETSNFWVLVNNILNIIFTVSLPIVIVLIIVGAILIVTAAGNERQISMGKNCIVYSLVGLSLVLMSKGIMSLIAYLLK
jgi:hypothetical protein